MADFGDKLLNGIKNMNVDNEVCSRINGVQSECFNINIGVRQEYIVSMGN